MPEEESPTDSSPSSQVVGAVTASSRAFIYQISSLYLRTPMKLFRPSRFDYMAYTRLALFYSEKLQEAKSAGIGPGLGTVPAEKYSFFKHSSIALLIKAVKRHGWRFVPDNVLPPILANSFTGLVLYTTYLTTLERFSRDSLMPEFADCFKAGFIAGGLQSIVAAPIDAIYTRSSAAELLTKKHSNLWRYGIYKLRNVGLIGVFAGFGISAVKESFGFAFYFATFEMIKNVWFSKTVACIDSIRRFKHDYFGFIWKNEPREIREDTAKYTVLKSSFILFAGASAATVLQVIQFPLTKIQNIHLSRLESLDYYNLKVPEYKTPQYNDKRYRLIKNVEALPEFLHKPIMKFNAAAFYCRYWKQRVLANPFLTVYYKSYLETLTMILTIQRKKNLTWWQWSYIGFSRNVVTTIPATSICLLVFEIMRSRLGDDPIL